MSLRRYLIACLALFIALAGTSYAAMHGSRGSSRRDGDAQAHTLPGDQLLAGPVLVDHRAVWVEAGHRLLVRSLDVHGRTRTIFSTSATPGAPKGTIWPFYVASIAAGDGRVAFIEGIAACGSAPPRLLRCTPSSYGPPTDSVTLFAGRPGAIRPVESLVQPERHSCSQEPEAVAVSAVGLVVEEEPAFPCPQGVPRLVLRTFAGRLVRVLARGWANTDGPPPFAAGPWAAFITDPTVVGEPAQLQIIRVTTGQVVLRLVQQGLDEVAVDGAGRFALMAFPGASPQPCQQDNFDGLSVGEIGHPGMQVLASRVWGLVNGMSIAGGRVAYVQPTGPCLTGKQVAIAGPGAVPTPVPGLKSVTPLAFDGRMVATAHGHTVQLTATPG